MTCESPPAGVNAGYRGDEGFTRVVPTSSMVRAWLDLGELLAAQDREEEAMGTLRGLLLPVMESPHILRLWLDLVARLAPGESAAVRAAVGGWAEAAMALLRSGPEDAGGAGGQGHEGFASQTLARLYWGQGHRERSLEMYRVLVERDPQNEELRREYRERLSALANPPGGDLRMLRLLEAWARRIRGQKGHGGGDEGEGMA